MFEDDVLDYSTLSFQTGATPGVPDDLLDGISAAGSRVTTLDISQIEFHPKASLRGAFESLGITSIEEIDVAFEVLDQRAERVSEYKSGLISGEISDDEFIELLDELESFEIQAGRLVALKNLVGQLDTSSFESGALAQMVNERVNAAKNKIQFFENGFLELPEERREELIEISGNHAYSLKRLSAEKIASPDDEETIRTEEAEFATRRLDPAIQTLSGLSFDLDATEVPFALLESRYKTSAQKAVRHAAWNQYLTRTSDPEFTEAIGGMYLERARNWTRHQVEIRGYSSPLEARLVRSDVPVAAIEQVLGCVSKIDDLFQRYFAAKARLLGLDRMTAFDVSAPVSGKLPNFSYPDAARFILAGLNEFHPEFGMAAISGFSNRRFDVEPRESKAHGGWTVPFYGEAGTYATMHFHGTTRDVLDLAHETGHGCGFMLAAEQVASSQRPSSVLIETPSILAELVVLSKVAREFPEAAHVLEAQQLDYLWRAISRPLGITRFEIEAYDMIASGAGVKDLDQARLKAFGERLGPQVEVDHRMGSDWRTITQVLKYPFSCTTYFFGALTALTLFGKHLEQGKAGAALAVDVFRAGSSMSPRELMLRAGVDICKPDCWKDAIFAIEKQVLSFEENLRRQGV